MTEQHLPISHRPEYEGHQDYREYRQQRLEELRPLVSRTRTIAEGIEPYFSSDNTYIADWMNQSGLFDPDYREELEWRKEVDAEDPNLSLETRDVQTADKRIQELLEQIENEDDQNFLRRMAENGDYVEALHEIEMLERADIEERNSLALFDYYNTHRMQGETALEIAQKWGAVMIAQEIADRYPPMDAIDETDARVGLAFAGSLGLSLLRAADRIDVVAATPQTDRNNHTYTQGEPLTPEQLGEIQTLLDKWHRPVGDADITTWEERPISTKFWKDRDTLAPHQQLTIEKEENNSPFTIEMRNTQSTPQRILLVRIGDHFTYPVVYPSEAIAFKLIQAEQRPDKETIADDLDTVLALGKIVYEGDEEEMMDRVRQVYQENKPKAWDQRAEEDEAAAIAKLPPHLQSVYRQVTE